MNGGADVARRLYLELRVFRFKVRLEEDHWGTGNDLNYGIVVDGLHLLSAAHASSVTRRVWDNENDLVRLLANKQNVYLCAIRGDLIVGGGGPAACVRNPIKKVQHTHMKLRKQD